MKYSMSSRVSDRRGETKPSTTIDVSGELGNETKHTERGLVSKIRITFIESVVDSLKNTTIDIDMAYFNTITIGRAPENIIVIPDITVSRKHAAIMRDVDGSLVLVDLNSKNGTYIYSNGSFERVDRVKIRDGMIIRLGMYTVIKVSMVPVS